MLDLWSHFSYFIITVFAFLMAAITTGLSALLHMCSSGRIDKSNTIHYLIYDNTYDKSRFSSLFFNEELFASDIAKSLGYNIKFYGPYTWWCPPPYERTSTKEITHSRPEVKLDDINHVSANALFFLSGMLDGKAVEVFPEGASCFARYASLGTFPNIWIKKVRPRMESLKRTITRDSFKITKYWLLPDRFGHVRSATKGTYRVDVFNEKSFYDSYKKSSRYFVEKYKELDFSSYGDKIVFHPLLESLSENNYEIWTNELKALVGDLVLFVKSKPRMNEIHIPDAIKKFNFLSLSKEFNALPAELILDQFHETTYFGYYSSMILGFHSSSVMLVPPPDNDLKILYDRCYGGLKSVLSI